MRRGLHDDQTQRMIGTVFGAFVFAEAHDGIEEDARLDVFRRQGSLLLDLVAAVVAQAADVTAVGGDDFVEQREFRVAAVLHVAAAGFQGLGQHGPLVGLAAADAFGDVDADRHAAFQVELGVQAELRLELRRPRIGQRGLDQHGQALQQRAIDQRQGVLHVFQPRIAGDRLQLFAQFGDDFLQPLGLEDIGGLAERAQRRPLAAEFALDLPQFAGLLDGPQGADHGIEQEQQHEHAVLVEMQLAVAGLVALAAHVVQASQQRSELVEILQARHVLFAHVLALLAGHAG